MKARAKMIKANLRLVVKIAHDYGNLGLPLLDLVSEGNIGLMKAVERFDPAKGGKLSTYAAWWIKQSIKRALANQSKTIRLPVHLVDKIAKMKRLAMAMSEELGREPTDDELAEEVGISAAKLSQLRTVSIRPASLDAPMNDDDGTEFGEIVGDDNAVDPAENLADKNLQEEVADLLGVARRPRAQDHQFALRPRRRQSPHAGGSRPEIRRDPRAHPPAPKHRAGQTAPRAAEARAPDRAPSVVESRRRRHCGDRGEQLRPLNSNHHPPHRSQVRWGGFRFRG